MSNTLHAAMAYASMGWHLVPVHGIIDGVCQCRLGKECGFPGRHPIGMKWQDNATTDEDRLAGWFTKWPHMNVGLKLGPDSGVIDIEFDSDEGRQTAERFFEGVITPSYESGRSIHRIFKWHPDLPIQDIFKFNGLEVRLGSGTRGFQSVIPPSQHHSGNTYRWLHGMSPDEVEPIEIPEQVLSLLWAAEGGINDFSETNGKKRPESHWEDITNGVQEGGRNDALASMVGKLLRNGDIDDRGFLQVTWSATLGVNNQFNPPLSEKEVNTVFQSILRAEQNRRVTEAASELTAIHPEEVSATSKKQDENGKVNHQSNGQVASSQDKRNAVIGSNPSGWRLKIVDSDPMKFFLYAPQFQRTGKKFITLTAEQMHSVRDICVQALKQAKAYISIKKLRPHWEGVKGKAGWGEILTNNAEIIDAYHDEKEFVTIARVVVQHLTSNVDTPTDGRIAGGKQATMLDGILYFMSDPNLEKLHQLPGKLTRNQLSGLYRRAGICDHKGQGTTWKKCTPESMDYLERLASGEDIDVQESENESEGESGNF